MNKIKRLLYLSGVFTLAATFLIILFPLEAINARDNLTPPIYSYESGIYGEITIGPITPVCRIDVPCDRPYQATVKVETQDESQVITQFTSNKNGKFRMKLQPGTYVLLPITETPLYPRGYKQTVEVKPHNFTRVTIYFDTGIR